MSAGAVQKDQLVSFLEHALPDVYGYLLHRTQQQAVAEDLTSETLLAAIGGMVGCPAEQLSVPWLIGIARHKLTDHWRREARELHHLEMIVAERSDDAPEVEFEEGPAFATLSLLNPTQRLALTMRYVDGLSVPEVAELIGRSVHATETLLVRARAAFRDRYEEVDRDGL